MYDVRNDPECMNNLAAGIDQAAAKAALKQQLLTELKAQRDPRVLGQWHVFDEYPNALEKWRNFYEWSMNGDADTANWINPSDIERWPIE